MATASKIIFGNGLNVTDEGSGTIRVAACAAAGDLPYMVSGLGDWAGGSPWNARLPMDLSANMALTSDTSMFTVQTDGIVVQSDGVFAVAANIRTTGHNPMAIYVLAYTETGAGTFVAAYQSVWGESQQADDTLSGSYAQARFWSLFAFPFTGAATQVRFFVSVEDIPHSGASVTGKSLSVIKLSAYGTGSLSALDFDI